MPGRLLDGGAATKVEVPAGKRGRATGRSRALEHQYPCAGGSRADRRAAAPDAEADHHDVDIIRPRRHVVSGESCWYLGAHRCSCLM